MKISDEKIKKISEQILNYLYLINPKSIFTSHIAKEIARDEEFTKKILFDLREKRLILEIKKSKNGKEYLRRSRWKLSPEAFSYYSSN